MQSDVTVDRSVGLRRKSLFSGQFNGLISLNKHPSISQMRLRFEMLIRAWAHNNGADSTDSAARRVSESEKSKLSRRHAALLSLSAHEERSGGVRVGEGGLGKGEGGDKALRSC